VAGGQALYLPSATEGFDELHGDVEALAGELGAGSFGRKGLATGVHDFEIADNAGAVTVGGQVGRAPGVGDGALLRSGLLGQIANACEAVLDIAKGEQDLLTIVSRAFFKRGLGALVVGADASAREQR